MENLPIIQLKNQSNDTDNLFLKINVIFMSINLKFITKGIYQKSIWKRRSCNINNFFHIKEFVYISCLLLFNLLPFIIDFTHNKKQNSIIYIGGYYFVNSDITRINDYAHLLFLKEDKYVNKNHLKLDCTNGFHEFQTFRKAFYEFLKIYHQSKIY